MKKVFFIFLVTLIILGCKPLTNCETFVSEFSSTTNFLEGYLNHEGETKYDLNEVNDKILYLENLTGIQREISGDWLGSYRVTEKDLEKWKRWFNEKCKKD